VKSTAEMVNTAQDLAAVGISLPIMVGGAALTKRFTLNRILPAYQGGLVVYAKDAMNGLDLANKIQSPGGVEEMKRVWVPEAEGSRPTAKAPEIDREKVVIDWAVKLNPAPDYIEHIEANASLVEIWDLINPKMLYNKHLGFRGNFHQKLAEGDEKAVKLHEQVEAVKEEILSRGYFTPQSVYRFFKATAEGNEIFIIDGLTGKEQECFKFPRQSSGSRLCLSDFVKPKELGLDDVAFFVTTCGGGIRELAEQFKASGDYLKSHILQLLALESAEGYAELLHKKIRRMWGIADDPSMTKEEIFQADYQGVRVSFGYPACPRLEDQAILWRLLRPERIGVELTEGYMMDPEASVSAMVFQHPQARYFAIGPEDMAAFEKEFTAKAG
jgi:5-methyltetrahydrofolate--homocysteine methyltransferase